MVRTQCFHQPMPPWNKTTSGPWPRRSTAIAGATSTLGTADVTPADEPEVIAELRLQAARPLAGARLLPLRGLDALRPRQRIEGDVLATAARAAEAPRAQHARHGGERGNVLLVVPLVELRLELRWDVHGVQQ